MRSATWISENGYTVAFAGRDPYYFKELTSGLSATAETQKAPRQDGVTTYHAALESRSINLVGAMRIWGDANTPALTAYDRAKTYLSQAFAPNKWGMLTYCTEDGDWQVRCRPVATPTFGMQVNNYCIIDIDFTADSPYWESAELYTMTVGLTLGQWIFPWSPLSGPMGTYNPYGAINNPTGEVIYPKVEIMSTGQYVTLTNETVGKSITIEHAIGQGQKLVVDMRDVSAVIWAVNEEGNYVELEDVSHWLSLDSNPWGLTPGDNRITIDNENPDDTPVTYIQYRIPALGV